MIRMESFTGLINAYFIDNRTQQVFILVLVENRVILNFLPATQQTKLRQAQEKAVKQSVRNSWRSLLQLLSIIGSVKGEAAYFRSSGLLLCEKLS